MGVDQDWWIESDIFDHYELHDLQSGAPRRLVYFESDRTLADEPYLLGER